MRCLEKEPSERFQSVAELVSALRDFQPEPVADCLAYLVSVRAGQSSGTRALVRRVSRAASDTLTDSNRVRYRAVDRPLQGGRRSRATLGFWVAGLALAVAGAWLLGRASGSSATLSSSSPSVPVNLTIPPNPTPLPPSAPSLALPLAPSSLPSGSEADSPKASPRPPAPSIKPAKARQHQPDSRAVRASPMCRGWSRVRPPALRTGLSTPASGA